MDELPETNRRNVLRTIGAGAVTSLAVAGSAAAHKGGLQGELAKVRSATAEYNEPENAYDDGYVVPGKNGPIPLEDVVDKGHAVCGMGFHFINRDNVGSTDPTVPAVLVYGVGDDDDLVLGAVEYAVPKAGPYAETPPDLFSHDGGDEEWGTLPTPEGRPDLWTLHVWVHNHNPDGVFTPLNPRELFHPEGCEGH